MGLESGTTIASLNASWPLGSDPKSQGDDHIRLIKAVMKNDVLAKAVGGQILGTVTIRSAFPAMNIDANGAGALASIRIRDASVITRGSIYCQDGTDGTTITATDPAGANQAFYRFDSGAALLASNVSVVRRQEGDGRYALKTFMSAFVALLAARGILSAADAATLEGELGAPVP